MGRKAQPGKIKIRCSSCGTRVRADTATATPRGVLCGQCHLIALRAADAEKETS